MYRECQSRSYVLVKEGSSSMLDQLEILEGGLANFKIKCIPVIQLRCDEATKTTLASCPR